MADVQSSDSGTVIGADTVIKGEMTVENRARILGRFEGTIQAKGQVEVADKAVCKADVEAATVQVDGLVEGNITAKDKASLNGTAKVVGDLVASKLVVSEGAAFKGHLHVGPDAIKASASAGAPAQQQPAKGPKGPEDQGKK
jgi:cytoskeletal protein CcmA (bactofilin family)